MKGFKQHTRKVWTATTGLGDRAFKHICFPEDPASTFEQCGVIPVDMREADDWLSEALDRTIKGELKAEISEKDEEFAREGVLIAGLQILWLLYRDFELEANKAQLYGVNDLFRIRDNKPTSKTLRMWYNTWQSTVAAQEDPVNDSTLKSILHECVQPIAELKRHMDAFLNTPRAEQTYKELSSRIKVRLKELELVRREEMSKTFKPGGGRTEGGGLQSALAATGGEVSCLLPQPRRERNRMQRFRPWPRNSRNRLASAVRS